jgi:hypothetical protein
MLDDVSSVTGNVRQSVNEVHEAVHDVKGTVEGIFGGKSKHSATSDTFGSYVAIVTTVIDLVSRFVPKKRKTRTMFGRRRR